jgi:hypothetical protein
MSPTKRIRKPVESPRNAFDAAKMITKALKNLSGSEGERAIRWAIEETSGMYPIRIVKGWPQ